MFSMKEPFTQREMRNYSNRLKVNCDKNTKIYKYLNKLNKEKCKMPGVTNRETINNKTICYDNIGKEITARLDMQSNCIMANQNNKKLKKKSKRKTSDNSKSKEIKSIISKNITPIISNKSTSNKSTSDKSTSDLSASDKLISDKSTSSKTFDKTKLNKVKTIRDQSPNVKSTDNIELEGPNFINKWNLSTYTTKKASDYSDISLSNPYNKSTKLAQISNINII